MLFKLHYFMVHSGLCSAYILLGVYLETYTDASTVEIGALFMVMPLLGIFTRPAICSMADRAQAYKRYLIVCQLITAISYSPFIIIPFLGPQIYEKHPRGCWYTMVVTKTIGDLAIGGLCSISDSLAINYARRVGTDFSVYRIWATISWMLFGLIIGQVNEVWFLPKYVPGFMILVGSSTLDIIILWLWPNEYFKMVTFGEKQNGDKAKQQMATSKCLMPRELVWDHAKGKLLALIGSPTLPRIQSEKPTIVVTVKVDDEEAVSKQQQQKQQQQVTLAKVNVGAHRREQVSKRVQFRILALLIRRDPRIVLCVLFFIGAGLTCSGPVPFLFLNLSELCHLEGKCDFSFLAGCLQASMAGIEIFLFLYMPEIKALMGRLNLGCFAVFLMLIKYSFYATIWPQVNPHYAIIIESIHGTAFGIYLTLMVECAHVFAQEVEFILPELRAKQMVEKTADAQTIKVSLSATMQALICSAYDGFGRGLGALFYGLIAKSYSYQYLWQVVAVETIVCFCSILIACLANGLFKLHLGPEPANSVADPEEAVDQNPDSKSKANGGKSVLDDNTVFG